MPDPTGIGMSNTCLHCKCKIAPFLSQCQVCEAPVPRQFDPSVTQHAAVHRYQHHGIVNKLASDYVCSLFGASPSTLGGPSCINNDRSNIAKQHNSIEQITNCNFLPEQPQNLQHSAPHNHMNEANMACVKCERSHRPDARFCDWCGHKLYGHDNTMQMYPPPMPPPTIPPPNQQPQMSQQQAQTKSNNTSGKKTKVKKNKNGSLIGKKSKNNLKKNKSSSAAAAAANHIKAKRKLAKMLRNEGLEYVNPVSNKVFAAVQRGTEPCLCRFRCFERVSLETQEYIFKGFWALKDYDKQTAYLYPNIEILPVRRRVSKKSPEEKKNRICSPVYYVSLLDGTVAKVCKKAFLSFHGIKKGRVNHILKQKKIGLVLPTIDGRGKHNNRKKKSDEEEGNDMNTNSNALNQVETITCNSFENAAEAAAKNISSHSLLHLESTTAAVAKNVISSHNLLHLSTVKPFSLTSI